MGACRRCDTDLLHCHGTLVRHGEGEVECSDPRCAGRVAVHDFVIVCDDVQSGCCRERRTTRGRVRRRRAVVRSA